MVRYHPGDYNLCVRRSCQARQPISPVASCRPNVLEELDIQPTVCVLPGECVLTGDCVLIYDRADNIDLAWRVGISSVHSRGNEMLHGEIGLLGLVGFA